MQQYHINEKGDVNACTAKQGRCPYGGSRDHFESAEEAREAYEAEQSMADLMAKVLRANPRTVEMEEKLARNEALVKQLFIAYATSPEVEVEFGEIAVSELHRHNDEYQQYAPLLTPDEEKALYEYAGIAFDPINSYLRDPKAFLAKRITDSGFDRLAWAKAQISLIDAALAKAAPVKRTLFRRLDQSSMNGLVPSEQWASELGFVPGEQVTFASYSSTTVNPGYIARTVHHDPHTSVVLVIASDQGTPVSTVITDRNGSFSTQEAEAEILLPRNATFKVTEVKRAGYVGEDAPRSEVLTVFLEQVS